MRIYLAGEVMVEAGPRLVREAQLAHRQGRLAFAFLVLERKRAVTRPELAQAVWGDSPPDAWEVALSALLSKLRQAFNGGPASERITISSAFGAHQLRLPAGAWVDLEEARASLHTAEAALAGGRARDAYVPALVAVTILRRPLLAGEEADWVRAQRDLLHGRLVRALEVHADCLLLNEEPKLALQSAAELLALEPFSEAAYRLLMRAHAAAGDRAQALLAFERCRRLLADELGVDPSEATRALHRELLR